MRVRTRLLSAAVAAGTIIVPLVPVGPAGAVSTPSLDAAVTWLDTQQQADGGFEVSGFPGFETPDAVFALASAGQADATWSTTEALTAVEAVTTGGNDALDAVDDWVDSVQGGPGSAASKAQQAAKVIVLVTAPLGLDETDFDPSGDTATPVDLGAALTGGAGSGDYAALPISGRAFAAWALGALGEPVPPALVASIAAAQHPDGGFDFSGSPDGDGFDPDITAAVVIALRVGGAPQTDAVVRRAVTGLGFQQRPTGEWAGAFDDGNPNSTAQVMLMAATFGPADGACWRDAVEPRLAGVPYPSPAATITRRQQPDGRITSPSDGFGVNTFATTQAVQALAAAEGAAFYEGGCTAPAATVNLRIAQAYYVDLLSRLTEPGGAAYWAGQFDAGLSPALLAKRFTGTPEYSRVVADRVVRGLLDRPATADELPPFAQLVRSGQRLDLLALVLGGDEYFAATAPPFTSDPATDETWAAAVYLDTVGRAASPADVQFVVGQREAGRSRFQIARNLVRSAEGRGAFVQGTYLQLLRRAASPADTAFWGGELARGVSPERLVTLIIGSPEYKASTQAPA